LAAVTDDQWAALVTMLGRPDWTGLDRAQRRARHDEIDGVVGAWLAPRYRDEAVEALLDAGIPAAPVWDQNVQDALPQLVARRFNQVLGHPIAGPVPTPGIGMRSDGLDLAYRAAAPTVGQHTVEVLRELLDLSDDDLARLHAEGAI
jgi:crotonobetainyl-CoA:carnitine CoA-transferase CaiB-like acyl-CoA transferase